MKNGIKTFLIIGILFSNITTSHARQPQTVPMLKGCILSHQLDTLPSFKVYFNGAQTQTDENGLFSFPLEKQPEAKYYILICKTFEHEFEGKNTIKNLFLHLNTPYRFFVVTKNLKTGIWRAFERKLLDNTKSIPENCIIVTMHASRFDQMEHWTFASERHFAMLPKIVLRNNLETKNTKRSKSITRASIKSEIDSLGAKRFHTGVNSITQKPTAKPEVTISLIQ
jgi:hypothetical protein